MTVYKLSLVVPGRRDLGGLQEFDQEPKPGDNVWLGQEKYQIVEVVELMRPRNETIFLHATCQPAEEESLGSVS